MKHCNRSPICDRAAGTGPYWAIIALTLTIVICALSNHYAAFAAQSLNDEYDRNALYQERARIRLSWINLYIMNEILLEHYQDKPAVRIPNNRPF